jgi:DNA primase
MNWLDSFVTHCSELPEKAREALWARGVTDEQIDAYRIGYVDRVLPEVDLPESFRKWCSVGDRTEDSFILPLTNSLGDIRGVQLRHVERERSGYMTWFAVNDEPILFGLGQAMPYVWASKAIYLVEGAFDLFPVQRVFPGTVSTLTAHINEPLLRLLRRLTSRVVLGYDSDSAGRNSSAYHEKLLRNDFEVRTVTYPRVPMPELGKTSKDPSDLWEAWGETKFQAFLKPICQEGVRDA